MKKIVNKSKIKIGIILVLITSFIILSVTMSKYVFKVEEKNQIESTAFYFKSDITPNCIQNWDGNTNEEIGFNIVNYENTKLVTKDNILYNISVEKLNDDSNEIIAEIYNKDNVKISNNQVLNGGELNTQKYKLVISKNNNITKDTFYLKLKISSISPYKQEIISNITINMDKNDNDISSKIDDKGDYIELNINVNNLRQDKTITYDNTKLTVDKANALIKDLNISTTDNISSFIIAKENLKTNTNYKIYFIKIDSNNSIEAGKDIIID